LSSVSAAVNFFLFVDVLFFEYALLAFLYASDAVLSSFSAAFKFVFLACASALAFACYAAA